jgi:hypothetical protein
MENEGSTTMSEAEIDNDRIDDTLLALMYLSLHNADRHSGLVRSWKSFDWEVMNRLYAKEMIFHPVNKAKSVILTEEGRKRCEALF